MFDDFDIGPTCEEYYEEEFDWTDVVSENVTVNGIPLDGKYLDHLIEQI